MTQWHQKSKRKISGGIRTSVRKSDKKLSSKGNEPTESTVVDEKTGQKIVHGKIMGGSTKQKLAKATFANISTGNKVVKAKVLSVVENKANRLYTRRNILTQGAIVRVSADGQEKTAKVTSRPGQTGSLSAIFFDMPKEMSQKIAEKAAKKEKAQAEKKPVAPKI